MPWKFFTKYGTPNLPESVESTLETGQVLMYCGTSAPAGFLLCDGTEKAIASYPDLYTFFTDNSLSFGAPTSPANFVLPNLLDRFPVGLNTADLDFASIGQTGGNKSHDHVVPLHSHSSPTHSHGITNHTHEYFDHTHPIPSHSHGYGTTQDRSPASAEKIWVYNQMGDPLVAVEYASHAHPLSGSLGSHSGGATTSPKNADGTNKDYTDNPSVVTSTSMEDTAFGPASPAVTVPSTGAGSNSSVPPYRTINFIIKV